MPRFPFPSLLSRVLKSKSPVKRSRQLAQLLDAVELLPFDRSAVTHAADIRFELQRLGTPIGPLDILIAGTARARDAVLVTRKSKEFSRVPRLKIENWFDE